MNDVCVVGGTGSIRAGALSVLGVVCVNDAFVTGWVARDDVGGVVCVNDASVAGGEGAGTAVSVCVWASVRGVVCVNDVW